MWGQNRLPLDFGLFLRAIDWQFIIISVIMIHSLGRAPEVWLAPSAIYLLCLGSVPAAGIALVDFIGRCLALLSRS
jgi:hypothetical protein